MSDTNPSNEDLAGRVEIETADRKQMFAARGQALKILKGSGPQTPMALAWARRILNHRGMTLLEGRKKAGGAA